MLHFFTWFSPIRISKKLLPANESLSNPLLILNHQLGSCSVDLRLGNTFRVFDYSKYPYIDPAKKDYSNEITKVIKVPKDGSFIMQPGDFVLAVTLEHVKLPADLMGRSGRAVIIGTSGFGCSFNSICF